MNYDYSEFSLEYILNCHGIVLTKKYQLYSFVMFSNKSVSQQSKQFMILIIDNQQQVDIYQVPVVTPRLRLAYENCLGLSDFCERDTDSEYE